MKISPINCNYTSKKPAFRSIERDYELPNYDLKDNKMGLYTRMFREDQNWEDLAKIAIDNFKNKDKVNIVQFAPSDGSESYTQILSLINKNAKEAEKFFPIQAYDINEEVVRDAKSGHINLNAYDIYQLRLRGININNYFKETNLPAPVGSMYKTTDELAKRVQFNIGDMFKVLPSIKDDSNTIICARNSLAYFTFRIESFVRKASEILKSGSLFVVGLLEEDFTDISKLLKKYKFEHIAKNIYRKI